MQVALVLGALLLVAGPALPQGSQDQTTPVVLELANSGPYVIHAAYVVPSGTATWGPNLLARPTLKKGDSVQVSLDMGCGTYNVRLVAEDGIEFLDDDVPLCSQGADSSDMLIVGKAELSRTHRVPDPPAAPR